MLAALEIDDYQSERHRLVVNKHCTPDGVIVGTKSNRLARGQLKTREVPTDLPWGVGNGLVAAVRRRRLSITLGRGELTRLLREQRKASGERLMTALNRRWQPTQARRARRASGMRKR